MYLCSKILGLLLVASIVAGTSIGASGQTVKEAPATKASTDEEAIRLAGAAYREAFAKGDIDAIASFWTSDADFVDQSGRAYKVHPGLERAKQLSKELGTIAQPLRKTEILSIRFVTPDVALEDGIFERPGADADESREGRYTAVWVKRDGKWLLDGERESPVRAEAVNDPLESLAWMVGEWVATGPKSKAEITCTWGPDKSYLLRKISVQPAEGEKPLSATQWIGWDPHDQRIRSFLFDSRGGFTEAVWKNEGDAWVVRAKGVLRDGKRSSATNLYSRIDENNWTIESLDDEIDGQPAPEVNLHVSRKQAKK